MIKKTLFALTALMTVCFLVTSKAYSATFPETSNGGSANPVYSGVEVSTLNGSSADKRAYGNSGVSSPGTFLGVILSSSPCNAYVEFRDTNTANHVATPIMATIYNINGSTTGAIDNGGISVCAGQYLLPYGIRFYEGLTFTVRNTTFNSVSVLYTKQGKQ